MRKFTRYSGYVIVNVQKKSIRHNHRFQRIHVFLSREEIFEEEGKDGSS